VHLTGLIDQRHVALGIAADGPEAALRSISEAAADETGIPVRKISGALQERERLGSTSVGDGFAIPHCKLDGLRDISVWLARLQPPGVQFEASDDRPVRFFVVVLSPPDKPAAHLQILSQVARILKRSEVRQRLLEAADAAEVLEIVHEAATMEGL
jgi:PTS system nitrogen regulatory IIA component